MRHRYPLFNRLALMLLCLSLLGYALFVSGGLAARLETGPPQAGVTDLPARLNGVHLLQVALISLFLLGTLLTLRAAWKALVQRTNLALAQCLPVDSGASAGADEIDRLACAFEEQSASLQSRVVDLERNLALARSQERFASDALAFLFRASRNLSENTPGSTALQALLDDLGECLQARRCSLQLLDTVAEDLNLPNRLPPDPDSASADVYVQRGQHPVHPGSADGNAWEHTELTVPLRDSSGSHGVLSVEVAQDFLLEGRQRHIVEAVANLVALSLGNTLRNQRRRRLALMDERNAIAGELHDSLAQALAYMKIQVARLHKELERSCNRCGTRGNTVINEVAGDIRTGLDSAYRHLRELLTAFRTNMPPGGLQSALREVVDELAARADTDISLDFRLAGLELTASEEFHILQMIREALTNVIRHARARHASVSLEQLADRTVEIVVEDDGKGLPADSEREGHYGLSIMGERAAQLGGHLQLGAAQTAASGTRVQLQFVPHSGKA